MTNTIWLAVVITESIVIVIINAFTLIVFARNRQLRKRSTYLIINLTVADLLVGAVTVPLQIYYLQADDGNGWQDYSISIAYATFPMVSKINLCLISLERLHATLYPMKHYSIQERFYFISIICSWFLALLLASVNAVLRVYIRSGGGYYLWAWASLIVVTLLTLTVSYVIIILKIKSSPPPHPGGAVASDRELSITLFIVTIVSVVTILFYAIYTFILLHMPLAIQFRIEVSAYALYYACSIVNPVIYAIRMQEFRKAVYKQLTCGKSTNSNPVHPIDLQAM